MTSETQRRVLNGLLELYMEADALTRDAFDKEACELDIKRKMRQTTFTSNELDRIKRQRIDLYDKINAFRTSQYIPPTYHATMMFLIKKGLEAIEKETK